MEPSKKRRTVDSAASPTKVSAEVSTPVPTEEEVAVVDQISQLPDHILQHILFLLPAKDAAQTSVLSKTWLKFWNLLPVFTFDFDENLFLREQLSEESNQADERDLFLSTIESSLTDLRIQKAIIPKFRLSLTLRDLESASCINEWIRLASRNCINELDIDIMCDRSPSFVLPGTAIFTAKTLVVLRVRGCKLERPLFVGHVKLTDLRKLFLNNVFLDKGMILEIISACPVVEELGLIRCLGVGDLLITDLPKLLKLTLHQEREYGREYGRIQIQAVNLQRLSYGGCMRGLNFNISAFKHLKELIISNDRITTRMLQNLVSELPLLEKLQLDCCYGLMRLRFSSCVLRQLTFYSSYKSLIEVVINTPKLLCFEYGAPELPSKFSLVKSSLREFHLKLLPYRCLRTSLFQTLRECLPRFAQLKLLILSISSWTNTFMVEELKISSSCAPSIVNHLKLQDVNPSLNFEALLDGLLWACHPRTLSADNISEHNSNFIQFLREKLMGRELVPACCETRRIKCWRHYLKDVEVESSTTNPSSPDRVATICLKLKW